MNNYLLSLMAILFPAALFAQDIERASNKVSLQYGLHQLSRQDQLFSPMIYHDVSFQNIAALYANENSQRWHTAEIFYSGYEARWHDDYTDVTGAEEKVQTTAPTFITIVGVRYSYLKKIKVTEQGSWSVGGISDNQINAVDNVYGAFGTFGYLGQFSLSPMVRKQFIEGKHEVLIDAFFPLLSWVSRSPYALNDDEYMKNNADHNGFKTVFRYIGDGNIQTVNRLQKFNLDAAYSYSLSDRWQLGGVYRMEFLRSSKPKPLIAVRNNFNLILSFEF
mgnify:CR=1 FL=1